MGLEVPGWHLSPQALVGEEEGQGVGYSWYCLQFQLMETCESFLLSWSGAVILPESLVRDPVFRFPVVPPHYLQRLCASWEPAEGPPTPIHADRNAGGDYTGQTPSFIGFSVKIPTISKSPHRLLKSLADWD